MTDFRLGQKVAASLFVLPLILALGACSATDPITFGPHATAGYGSSSPPRVVPRSSLYDPYANLREQGEKSSN